MALQYVLCQQVVMLVKDLQAKYGASYWGLWLHEEEGRRLKHFKDFRRGVTCLTYLCY